MIELPRWLRLPAQEVEDLRRCRECGKLIRETQEELVKHVGHHFEYPAGIHINEYVRILTGWL